MERLKISIIFGALLMLVIGCVDEDKAPILTFEAAGKGAYPARVSSSGGEIRTDDLAGSRFTYTIEFIDLQAGTLVSEYKASVSFTDYDESDGNSSAGPVDFLSFSSSEFTDQASGNKGLTDITVTGTDLLNALGLTADDLKGGGQFDVKGTVTTVDGAVFTSSNSSSSVNGSAFRGFFDYTLFVICPSDLGGTYDAVTVGSSTDGCCPGEVTVMSEVTLTDKGSGLYEISDWSGGIYLEWYDIYGINETHNVGEIQDACSVVSFVTKEEPFGESLEGSGKVGADGVITLTWLTGYGDKATVTLTKK